MSDAAPAATPGGGRRWRIDHLRYELTRRGLSTEGTKEDLIKRLQSSADEEGFEEYINLRGIDLRQECKQRGLPSHGSKNDMMHRLRDNDRGIASSAHPASPPPNRLFGRSSTSSHATASSEQDDLADDASSTEVARPPSPQMVEHSSPSKKPFQFSPSAWTPKAPAAVSTLAQETAREATPIFVNSSRLTSPIVLLPATMPTLPQRPATAPVSPTAAANAAVVSPRVALLAVVPGSPDEARLRQLREEYKRDEEALVLWRNPGRTMLYFLEWCYDHLNDFSLWALERSLGIFAVSLVVAGLAYLYQIESHKSVTDPIISFVQWYGGWVLLGIASSFGVGTGMHTFLLYLGPFIAATVLRSESCGNLDFVTTNTVPWPSGPFKFQCLSTEQQDFTLWDVIGKVRFEAFAWGLGTAIGELPPFFFARAARMAGEQLDDHEDLEQLSQQVDARGWASMDLSHRAKVVCYRVMKHTGFFGIMLLASVPNPLFDLAGIFSGYMLISFFTFFGATLVGKAINKASLQTWFVISMFYGGKNSLLLQMITALREYLPAFIMEPISQEVARERERYTSGNHVMQERGVMSVLFDLVLVAVLAWCAMTVVNSLAQAKRRKKLEADMAAVIAARPQVVQLDQHGVAAIHPAH